MFGAARQLRELRQRDLFRVDVRQFAGVDIVKMVVRPGRRVEKHARGVHHDLADEALSLEQAERIVYGRARAVVPCFVKLRQEPIRGQMLRTREQDAGDIDALGGRFHTRAFEALDGYVTV